MIKQYHMKNILTILSLFISVNFYSQIIHPQDGTNIKELFCGQSVPYFDPGGHTPVIIVLGAYRE